MSGSRSAFILLTVGGSRLGRISDEFAVLSLVCKKQVQMDRAAVLMLWLVLAATLVVGRSQPTTHYRSCSLGKGKAKLYNCNDKYDTNGTKTVRISDISTPSR